MWSKGTPGAETVGGSDMTPSEDIAWLRELHLGPSGPPWWSMGTSRTEAALTPIADPDRKRSLLRDRRDDVIAAVPDAEHVLPALERAALRVEEDLCLLTRTGDEPFGLAAACVCAPSHWVLREKIGLPVAAIHGPVPLYESELAAKVDGFINRLRDGIVVGRRNWTIHERDNLFAPVAPPIAGVAPAEQWLRSERQTLRRLPRSGTVLFTIRTQQVQLREVPPDVKAALAARVRAEPESITDYKHLAPRLPALLDYLGS
jgi:hypothetical protein